MYHPLKIFYKIWLLIILQKSKKESNTKFDGKNIQAIADIARNGPKAM